MRPSRPIEAGDIAQAVAELRAAPLDLLLNPDWLEKDFLLRLGLNDEVLEEFPAELYPWCGYGLKSWQYPRQFSRYLCFLASRNVTSYVEIGSRHGGTFIITVEYLDRFTPIANACAIDLEESPLLRGYQQEFRQFQYHLGSSQDRPARDILRGVWDLALIDGDHSREGCWADYQAVKDSARIVAVHDITNDNCPGVREVWRHIRSIVPARFVFEQTDQYRETYDRTGKRFLGIGAVAYS
ncbi:MAG TPA: hypothetical protein VIZ17_14125 [Acetobacteraceae bacterium]